MFIKGAGATGQRGQLPRCPSGTGAAKCPSQKINYQELLIHISTQVEAIFYQDLLRFLLTHSEFQVKG